MSVKIHVSEYYIQLEAESAEPLLSKLLSSALGIEKMRKKDTYRCSIRKLPEVLFIVRNVSDINQIQNENIRKLYDREAQRRRYSYLLKDNGPTITSDFLWPHQCLGVELAQLNNRFNFYYDTRTGKTLMCLQILYDRLKSGQARRCLVICPAAIIQAWVDDAAKHFPELKLAAFYGDAATRTAALSKPAHIVLWATNQVANNIDYLLSIKFDVCVFDESSKMKNHATKTAEASLKLSSTIPSWYNLSATPAPNGEEEYYTQMMCLDPYVFSPARTKFMAKYFNDESRSKQFNKWKIKPEKYEELMSTIKDYSLYVDQSIMPTAGKEWIVADFELNAEARDMYNQMRKNMAASIEGVIITAEMSAAMRAKLNQITSGFLMDTEARKENDVSRKLKEIEGCTEIYRLSDTSRVDCFKRILEAEEGNKCVIWANYREEFAIIREVLGATARYINGETSTADKEQYIYNDFKNGQIQYLVCHPLSVGMGINLTEAHIAIYYSLNDSWEALKQSSERIYGHITVQPHKCRYYVLQATDTVNGLIYGNLTNKRDLSTGFLEHLKARTI